DARRVAAFSKGTDSITERFLAKRLVMRLFQVSRVFGFFLFSKSYRLLDLRRIHAYTLRSFCDPNIRFRIVDGFLLLLLRIRRNRNDNGGSTYPRSDLQHLV